MNDIRKNIISNNAMPTQSPAGANADAAENDVQIVETAVEARQGFLGKRVLLILCVSLLLAAVAGFLLLGSVEL